MARAKPTPAPPVPPPAGALPHERRDWLESVPDGVLGTLKGEHSDLADAYAAAVDAIAQARDDYSEAEGSYRREVRDALAVSADPPPRPNGLDAAVREGLIAVALEDAELAKDRLCAHVLVCLAALREHRAELPLQRLDPELARTVLAGSDRALQAEKLRRELDQLEHPEREHIEDVSDPDLVEAL